MAFDEDLIFDSYEIHNTDIVDRTDRMYLSGITKIDGVPARARVACYVKVTDELFATAISDSQGLWQISHTEVFPLEGIYITAFDLDNESEVNAVTFDHISQVNLPE